MWWKGATVAIDHPTLERALAVIREGATQMDGNLVATDPWAVLRSAGIPGDALALLMQKRCLIGMGRMQFRIIRDSVPAPAPLASRATTAPALEEPAFLLVLDVENALHAHRNAGIPFQPSVIRHAAADIGTVAFAFAYANSHAVPQPVCEDLMLAGFQLIHCQRLRDPNGGKDTVDENIQDLIQRFLAHASIAGVVLVSDDRNFAPILNGIRDRGLRSIVLSLRVQSSLAAIAEVRLLPSPHDRENGHEPTTTRRWDPDLIIEDLRELGVATDPSVRAVTIRRIKLRAPFVEHLLRIILRKFWGEARRRFPELSPMEHRLSFQSILDQADRCVREEDRTNVSSDDVHAFLSALLDVGVYRRVEVDLPDGGGRRPRYAPNWEHPFCADAIANLRDQPREQWRSRGVSGRIHGPTRPEPPMSTRPLKTRHVTCGEDGTTFRVLGVGTREDAVAAVRASYTARGAAASVLASIAAVGSPRRGTSIVELDATAPGATSSAKGSRNAV